jgi:ABC-type Fe3+ transport system permease subunit
VSEVRKVLQTLPVVAVGLGLALAQTQVDFDAANIASRVLQYIGVIVAAGVGVLAVTIGVSAAWRYAKRFLKG